MKIKIFFSLILALAIFAGFGAALANAQTAPMSCLSYSTTQEKIDCLTNLINQLTVQIQALIKQKTISASSNTGPISVSVNAHPIATPQSSSSITVVSPNGNESFEYGTQKTIVWRAAAGVLNVKIKLAFLSQQDKEYDIATVSASDNSYAWTVGYANGILNYAQPGSYKIAVYNADDLSQFDRSDNYFRVAFSSCTDSDNGMNYFIKGSTTGINSMGQVITASDYCSGTTGKVEEYFCGTGGYLKISEYGCKNGCSNGVCIADPETSISISSPASSETLTIGQKKTISWTAQSGVQSVNIDLKGYPSEYEYRRIATVPASQSNYQWSVGSTVIGTVSAGSRYKIRISDAVSGSVIPAESGVFSIVSASVPVCTEFTYSDWSSCADGKQTRTVIGSLPQNCTGGNPVISRACTVFVPTSCTDSDGGLDYFTKGTTIGLDYYGASASLTDYCYGTGGTVTPSSTGTKVHEYSCKSNGINVDEINYSCANGCENGACKTTANPPAVPVPPAGVISLSSPIGGESFVQGQAYNVAWQASNVGSVGIVLYDYTTSSSGISREIAWNIPASQGYYNWNISATSVAAGSKYKIKVFDVSDARAFDESDNYFSIISPVAPPSTPYVKIILPNGGQNFVAGQNITITWEKSGASGISLFVVDGTNSFAMTGAKISGNTATWVIPSYFTAGSSYKIKATLSENGINYPQYSDLSDNYFSISAPATAPFIKVVSPNGGESWTAGQTYNIAWDSYGLGEKVYIVLKNYDSAGVQKYSCMIADNVPNTGSYSFAIVPYSCVSLGSKLPTGDRFKIEINEITSAPSTARKDASDNYFSILPSVALSQKEAMIASLSEEINEVLRKIQALIK